MGCLFSKDEALGISVLEFLVLGVPATGFCHQGMSETIKDEFGLRFSNQQNSEEIKNILINYILDKNVQQRKIKNVHENREYFTWNRCLDEWKEILEKL